MERKDFAVKGYKQMMGTDGYMFECSLYVGGKRTARISNGGYGGCNDVTIIDKEAYLKFDKFVSSLGVYQPDSEFSKKYGALDYNDELFVEDLINDFLVEKEQKRWCKSKTVFSLPDSKEGEYRTFNSKYSPEMKQFVLGKYPEAIILNERY